MPELLLPLACGVHSTQRLDDLLLGDILGQNSHMFAPVTLAPVLRRAGLASLGMVGSIPNWLLGVFSNLVELDLSQNAMSGVFPTLVQGIAASDAMPTTSEVEYPTPGEPVPDPSLVTILPAVCSDRAPLGIASLSPLPSFGQPQIETLLIRQNRHITGQLLDTALRGMPELKELDIRETSMHGSIPEYFGPDGEPGGQYNASVTRNYGLSSDEHNHVPPAFVTSSLPSSVYQSLPLLDPSASILKAEGNHSESSDESGEQTTLEGLLCPSLYVSQAMLESPVSFRRFQCTAEMGLLAASRVGSGPSLSPVGAAPLGGRDHDNKETRAGLRETDDAA